MSILRSKWINATWEYFRFRSLNTHLSFKASLFSLIYDPVINRLSDICGRPWVLSLGNSGLPLWLKAFGWCWTQHQEVAGAGIFKRRHGKRMAAADCAALTRNLSIICNRKPKLNKKFASFATIPKVSSATNRRTHLMISINFNDDIILFAFGIMANAVASRTRGLCRSWWESTRVNLFVWASLLTATTKLFGPGFKTHVTLQQNFNVAQRQHTKKMSRLVFF